MDVCVLFNKTTAAKFAAGKLHELPLSTRNRLYVAITHARGNVYFIKEEKLAFETYIEGHQQLFDNKLKEVTRFNHIHTESDSKTELYRTRLNVGVALNELITDWRSTVSNKNTN